MIDSEEEALKKLREVNGLLGALDGKTIARTRRIIQLHTVTGWALDRLCILLEHSNPEYAREEKKRVLAKLEAEYTRIDEELKKATE